MRLGIRCARRWHGRACPEGTWWSCAEVTGARRSWDRGSRERCCWPYRPGISPGPLPDRRPKDPHHRLAVPAAGHRGIHADDSGAGDPQPAAAAAASAAASALSTLGAYLLAVWIGLFGFKEIRTRAGLAAGLIPGGGLRHAGAGRGHRQFRTSRPARPPMRPRARLPACLADRRGRVSASAFAGTRAHRRRPGPPGPARAQRAMSMLVAAVSAVSVAALALLGVAVVSAGGSPVAAADVGATLKTVKVGGVDVLANADGLTLYWFAPDTSTSSKCFGSCTIYWPPVSGSPAAPRRHRQARHDQAPRRRPAGHLRRPSPLHLHR